jgi:hypothetical protein
VEPEKSSLLTAEMKREILDQLWEDQIRLESAIKRSQDLSDRRPETASLLDLSIQMKHQRLDTNQSLAAALEHDQRVFQSRDGSRVAVIHPSSREGVAFQISYFDHAGPYAHDDCHDVTDILDGLRDSLNQIPVSKEITIGDFTFPSGDTREGGEYAQRFESTVARDSLGKPAIVYGIDHEQVRFAGPGAGMYVSREEVADDIALEIGEGSRTTRSHLFMEHPLIIDADGSQIGDIELPTIDFTASGYDGIMVTGTADGSTLYFPASKEQVQTIAVDDLSQVIHRHAMREAIRITETISHKVPDASTLVHSLEVLTDSPLPPLSEASQIIEFANNEIFSALEPKQKQALISNLTEHADEIEALRRIRTHEPTQEQSQIAM